MAAEERLRKLCGRTIEMWVKGYGGGPGALQPRRRRQQRPVDEVEETPQKSDPHFLLLWYRTVLRVAAAFVAESRICQILLKHYPRQFIRSLESASVDGALLLDDFFDPAEESFERHNRLDKDPKYTPPFLPIDVKHAVACPIAPNERESRFQAWYYHGGSMKHIRGGILILTSATDPDRVAIVPANAALPKIDSVDDRWVFQDTDQIPEQTYPPAFGSDVKPFEVSISEIPKVLSRLLECTRDKTGAWSVVVEVPGPR